jgi:NAD(P)-dependent dehydrogenase (short-subunit alcohol dehydrogenase family)
MGRLQDKVAIVTGGGQGLGFGIAQAFADEGAKLVLTGRVQDKLDAKAEILRAQGTEVLAIAGDVRDRATAKDAVARALAAFGRLDIVVNNAQTLFPHRPLDQQDDDQLDATIQSGLFGTIYFMQEAYPALRRQGGSIINFGSLLGVQGGAGSGAYAAAKEGIRGVSRVAARDWGKDQIRVNTICPGAMSETFVAFFENNPEQRQIYEAQTALGRFADPVDDVGRLAVFLAGDDCFLTGQTLHCDGGQLLP